MLRYLLLLFLSGIDDSYSIIHTTILTGCFLICCLSVIALLHKVCHLAEVYKLVADDLIVCIKAIPVT